MKMDFRRTFGLISLPLFGITLFVASFHIGSRIAAAPMEKLRSAIKDDMSYAEVQALIQQYDGVTDDGVIQRDSSKAVIQVSQVSRNLTSPLLGSWLCFLKLQMGENGVESVSDVFCVD